MNFVDRAKDLLLYKWGLLSVFRWLCRLEAWVIRPLSCIFPLQKQLDWIERQKCAWSPSYMFVKGPISKLIKLEILAYAAYAAHASVDIDQKLGDDNEAE